MEDFLSGLLQKACVFCFASSCYSRSRRSSLEEIIIPPDFDSKCGFSQKNINNINESVREFSKV